MKKVLFSMILLLGLFLGTVRPARAQSIPGVGSVAGLVKRVIKAIDLEVQRLQNQTIWLQNAQKTLENQMSKLHLQEITDWAQKQKDLYDHYYQELWQVKTVITYYHRVKEISDKQVQLVNAYNRAWGLLRTDKHFTPDELSYMDQVYSGILDATLKNAGQLLDIVSAFTTQMSDADRMKLINRVADQVDQNYGDLTRFNTENSLLSIGRAKDDNEVNALKKIYGLP